VNPWSDAGVGGAEIETDESLERALFAHRAGALKAGIVPPLASVLRAVETTRELHAERGASGRAFVAMALVAACVMGVIAKLPRIETTGSITADVDASAPGTPGAASESEGTPGALCSIDDGVCTSEERACFSPAPPSVAGMGAGMSATHPAPTFTPVPATHACGSNESCAMPNW
jgi:hypothetical protein